jgi:hypothetical protein
LYLALIELRWLGKLIEERMNCGDNREAQGGKVFWRWGTSFADLFLPLKAVSDLHLPN